MKKPLLPLAIVGCAAVLIFFALRSQKASESARSHEPARSSPQIAAAGRVAAQTMDSPDSADNEVIAALRKAFSSENYAGLEAACERLKEYIENHPERVSEFIEFMRTEKDEFVLRQFTLVLARTEVGLLENDQLVQTVIDLARDTSFEQRQHIMLHLMAQFPQIRDDVFSAISEICNSDPNPQVKTSGVVALADWMDRFPDQSGVLMEKIGEIFKTAKDEDVRMFTYQVMALHKEQLPLEMFDLLNERFKDERDPFAGNLLACALFAAPDSVREVALRHARSAFETAQDHEDRRNYLLQLVCLSRGEIISLLEKLSPGDSMLAEDARGYLAAIRSGPFEPQQMLADKAMRDGNHSSCSHPEHQRNQQ